MADLTQQINEARKGGYSDEEIAGYLGKSHPELAPKFQEAARAGYKPAEILAHLSTPPADTAVRDHLKDEGFLDSAWQMIKSPFSMIGSMVSGDYGKDVATDRARAKELEKNGTTEQRREFAKEYLLKALPGASTVYKAVQGNIPGAVGDVVGMVTLGAAAKGVTKAVDMAPRVADVVKSPEFRSAALEAVVPAKVAKAVRVAKAVYNAASPAEAVPAEAMTPGQILAQQSGADWAKLSPSDQAILEHVAKAQAQANAAPQPPRPPMGPPQATTPVETPTTPVAPSLSIADQIRADVAARNGTAPVEEAPTVAPAEAPKPTSKRQPPARLPQGYQRVQTPLNTTGTPLGALPEARPVAPAPEALTSQMASEPTAPVAVLADYPELKPAPGASTTPAVEAKAPTVSQGTQRGIEKIASNRTAKAQRFAQALHDNGISAADAVKIEAGHLGDSQIQAGMAPRWGNIAQLLGEDAPSSLTMPQIIGELKKLETPAPGPVEVPSKRAPGGGMGGMKNYFVDSEASAKAPAPEAPVNGNGKPKGKKSAPPVETSPIADEIAAHIKQKTDNPLPWAKLVGDHGDAVQAFEKLLNGDAPNQAALAAAAAEVDRLAGPMEHELHGRAATLTAQDVAETHGKTVTGDPLPAPAPRGKNPDAMTPEEFRAAHAPEPITPTKELAKQPTKSAGKAPALTAEVEEEALRAWAENRAYIKNGQYHVKPTDESGHTWGNRGPIAPWNRAIKTKYPDSGALHKAAQQYYKPKK